MVSQGIPGGVSRYPNTGYIKTFLKKSVLLKNDRLHISEDCHLLLRYCTGCCIHMCRQNVLFRKIYVCGV